MTQMWKIENGKLVSVTKSALPKEEILEDWLENDPSILGLDILIIGRQVNTPHGGRIDLLGIDFQGDICILELKRDKTPRDVVAQILDYASWVCSLTSKEIHEIASQYLGKPLVDVFSDHFSAPIPDNLNSNHSMIIVASEFDESSKRIVQYLAEEHGLSINTAFFNIFKSDGQEYMTADWLMDQQEVAERAVKKKLPPWTGYWYVNVGDGDCRSWEDCRKYGFIAAGNGSAYSKPLYRLNENDKLFAYQKGKGYVGYGIVTKTVVMAKDFEINGRKLLELELKEPLLVHDKDDSEMAEYVVGIDWKKTLALDSALSYKGIFANQNIVCKLRNQATLDFLKSKFEV